MSRFLLLLSAVAFIAYGSEADAIIQCKCPSVAAEAKGNSSCSATETGSQCTIDFNQFPASLESKAASELSKVLGDEIRFPPSELTADVVNTQDSALALKWAMEAGDIAGFNDLLLVYLSVAVSSREDAEELYDKNADFFRNLRTEIGNNSERLRGRFDLPKALPAFSDANPEVFSAGNIEFVVSFGCLEARTDNIWVMYKAFWAATQDRPNCRGE